MGLLDAPKNGVKVPWKDGSGDSFYLDFTTLINTSEAFATSDVNLTGKHRKRTICLKTMADIPNSSLYFTIEQDVNSIVVVSYNSTISVYDDTKAGSTC